ncbi:Gar1/Naf1 RNA binding region-domain-containing protein [Podospora appendiculata]|uniref:H/ACA ribonucleoprotein complex non-core subunit NAF1 n=1 Tax=Podospora appendiculata TaxID=314037 RepID=A0AAE0X7F4_9PEZI|nr:Gar1/Naf1 RNA binding region-domain-containing protein [Podospora appendiculata]
MSDFQIPGLGQAKSNEQFPTENFAPTPLHARSSPSDGTVDGESMQQWDNQALQKSQEAVNGASAGGVSTDIDNTVHNNTIHDNTAQKDHAKQDFDMADHDQARNTPTSNGNEDQAHAEDVDMDRNGEAPGSPDITHFLEAALATAEGNKHTEAPAGITTEDAEQVHLPVGDAAEDEGGPEWEEDSSPYESSDSSSSDSSSDDDSDDDNDHPILGIEETTRQLLAMIHDGDSDGETKSGKVNAAPLRTKNEMPEEAQPIPDITITPEMEIQPLGVVSNVVELNVVIVSKTPGEVQVLDLDSVLCKADRTIIGVLADTMGTVRNPFYIVAFRTEQDIQDLGLVKGTEIFYSVDHAKYVFTQELKKMKGCDASNLHDEEVAPDEMEFSDDEKEAEHRRQMKQKKRGGKAGRGGFARELPRQISPSIASVGAPSTATLNYDEDDDGPYRPLARPRGFAQGMPASLPSLPPRPEIGFSLPRGAHGQGPRGSFRGARGEFRGRNPRGNRGVDRGRGHRGGRGGSPQHSSYADESSQSRYTNLPAPLQAPPLNPHLPPPPFGVALPLPVVPAPAGNWPAVPSLYPPVPTTYPPHLATLPIPPSHQVPASNFNFNYQAWNQANGAPQYQYPPPVQALHQAPHQASHQASQASGYPQMPAPWAGVPPPPHTGAYVNPAFFNGQNTQQGQPQQAQPQQTQPQQSQQHQNQHQQQQQPPYWQQQQQRGGYGQGPR